jgi:hypothetical protein
VRAPVVLHARDAIVQTKQPNRRLDTAPDTTCLDDLVPVDFSGGDPVLVQQLFGTGDAWENDQAGPPAPLAVAAQPVARGPSLMLSLATLRTRRPRHEALAQIDDAPEATLAQVRASFGPEPEPDTVIGA